MPFFPRLAIFDLDGTLIDYEHDFLYTELLRIVRRFGLDHLTEETLAFHHHRDNMFGCIDCPDTRSAVEEAFIREFREEAKPAARLLPGALETLDYLATRKVPLAIATARAQLPESIRTDLKHTGLLSRIDCIASRSCRSLTWRDKSEQILTACRHAAVPPANSFMVGDNPTDSISARAVGIGGIIAVRSGHVIDELLLEPEPHHLLDSVQDIPDLLREHEPPRHRALHS